jgi:ubiquinone/menaquinone biosynthesis C-methylase UbiE
MAGERAKKLVEAIYSAAAERLYEPLVVNGAFKLFGGNLNQLAMDQGRRAAVTAAGRPILDMPVGTAFFTVPLAAAHDSIVVGCDIAEGMVMRARAAGREAGVQNLEIVRADAHHLPFAEGSFGAVMCTNGLQVIPGLEPALRELARVLEPGGVLYVSVLTLPLPGPRGRKPTMVMKAHDIAREIGKTGLSVETVSRDRLASLIEARK